MKLNLSKTKISDKGLSHLEKLEKLEQLRFLDNGFDIFVQDFKFEAPICIDTPEDLEAARIFAKKND